MIQLYHNDMSSCAQKVRIVLAEKGLEWKGHHLSLRDGESRTSEYKKLNPNGVVPTLITDSNETIIESTVIMEYLDEKYPTPPLKSVAPYSRALTRLWMKQLDEGIHLSLASISNALAFRYQHMEGKSQEELQKYFEGIPDPSRRERIWDLTKNGVESKHFLPAIQRFEKLFLDMEASLQDNKWIAGNVYSLADIAYMPYLTRFDHLNLLGMLEKLPHLMNWYQRVTQLESYREGIGKWLNDKYLKLMSEKGTEAWPRVKRVLQSH